MISWRPSASPIIRRVDHVAAGVDERVEDREARFLVGGPAEHVAAEGQRGDLQFTCAKRSHFDAHRQAIADPFITSL